MANPWTLVSNTGATKKITNVTVKEIMDYASCDEEDRQNLRPFETFLKEKIPEFIIRKLYATARYTVLIQAIEVYKVEVGQKFTMMKMS
jgi:hypothetical protein